MRRPSPSIGLVAISYGSQAVDSVTVMLAPVVGAKLDVLKNIVVPVTAAHADIIQVEALDREVCARNTFWQQHSQREEGILSDVDSALFQSVVTEHGGHQWLGRLVREAAVEMHNLAQVEAQRRTARRAGLALILSLECAPDGDIALPTIPEEQWTRLLERSPLFRLLKRVEMQLKHGATRAPLTDNCLVDVLECQWECEGELIPLDPSVLKPEEFLVYQHRLSLMHRLRCLQLTPDISLHIVSSLPSNYHNNAFRNCFFYQEADETLFVRRQRSVGGFSLLLLHCLSHVAVKDVRTDSAPDFQRLFSQVLQACLGEVLHTKLGLDGESAQGHLKGTLPGCGDAFPCRPQLDVEEVKKKKREMSLFSHLQGVLRKRILATEEGHQQSGGSCRP